MNNVLTIMPSLMRKNNKNQRIYPTSFFMIAAPAAFIPT